MSASRRPSDMQIWLLGVFEAPRILLTMAGNAVVAWARSGPPLPRSIGWSLAALASLAIWYGLIDLLAWLL